MPLAKRASPSVDGWRRDVANRELKSTNTKENEAKPYFRFQFGRPCLKDAAGRRRIVRHMATGAAGASGGQVRGADRRLAFRARRVVETVVFRFGARVCRVLPRRLRLAAGDRFSQRRGLQPPGAVDHTLLVATTRERDDRPGTLFNGDRASATDYAEITVSVPPNHKQGEIEWASTPPGDPNVDFVVRDEKYLDGDKAFVQALNAQLALRPPGSRNVFLFIHGFNTMFAEAVYRVAQLAHDSKAPGVPVLFTWASRGKATAYVYDLNSATAARDGLEHTLRLLLRSNAEKVNVLAHSMGNWVTVEAFRQIRISGDLPPASKIGTILLAAPDIDIDVFKSQLRRFGKPQKPFYVVLSRTIERCFSPEPSRAASPGSATAPIPRSSRRWGRR